MKSPQSPNARARNNNARARNNKVEADLRAALPWLQSGPKVRFYFIIAGARVRIMFLPFAAALLAALLAALPARAGVGQSGLGPKAVQSFGLERPEARPELEPGELNTKNPLSGLKIPVDALLSAKNGRVQLYSVSRLSDDDMRNPFEIRVQVAVEMTETVFEIGGIVEGREPSENTIILLVTPPAIREPSESGEGEEADAAAAAKSPGTPPPPPKKEQRQKISVVCSVGDIVHGYRIHQIDREGMIVERESRFVQVPRGSPVTICVPVTLR